MATNAELRHAAFRSFAGTTGTYTEDAISFYKAKGHSGTNIVELEIIFLQSETSSSATNINDLRATFAVQLGVNSYHEITGNIDTGGAPLTWDTISTNWNSIATNWDVLG